MNRFSSAVYLCLAVSTLANAQVEDLPDWCADLDEEDCGCMWKPQTYCPDPDEGGEEDEEGEGEEPEEIPEEEEPSDCGNDGQDSPCDCENNIGDPINPYRANLIREVTDLQTFGAGAIKFTRQYNSRAGGFTQPYIDFSTNQTWQHNWNFEMRQLSSTTYGFKDIKLRYPAGLEYNFVAADTGGMQLVPAADSGDRLYRWSGSTVGYTLVTREGWEYDFQRINSPKFQLLQVRDGQGMAWTLNHDSNGRVTKITNKFGRYIEITRSTVYGVEVITAVTASDGRQVTYGYSQWTDTGEPVLTSVTYPDSSQATYGWVGGSSLTTGRPVLALARDVALGGPDAVMSWEYNYNAIYDYGNGPYLVTGTIYRELHPDTGVVLLTLPNGGGPHVSIIEGGGGTPTRRFTNGLLQGVIDATGVTKARLLRKAGGFGCVIADKDANGSLTRYRRDYSGRPTRTLHPDGSRHYWVYNSAGFVTHEADEEGRGKHFIRDSNNLVTQITHADNSYEAWTYDSNSQKTSHTDTAGQTTAYAYYGANEDGGVQGDLKSSTDALSHTTTFTWDSAGRQTSVTDALGRTTSFTYNWRGQVLTKTYADSTSTSTTYDSYGNKTSFTNELNKTWTYGYNEFNRLASVTDPLNNVTTYEYGRAPGNTATSYMGIVARVTMPSGLAFARTYDAAQRVLTEKRGAATFATTFNYSDAGDLSTRTDPLNHATTYTYDDEHRPVSVTTPLGRTTTTEYDSSGRITAIVDPAGRRLERHYDERGRITEVVDRAGLSTYFQYADAGQLEFIVDDVGRQQQFVHDATGQLVEIVYPDSSHEVWTRDAVGNPTNFTARNGDVQTTTFDLRNRPLMSTWASNGADTLRAYDSVGNLTSLESGEWNGSGFVPQTRVLYTYDDLSRKLSEYSELPDSGFPAALVGYVYDGDGRRTQLSGPDGYHLTYDYNSLGQASAIRRSDAGSPIVEYAYNEADQRLGRSLENSTTSSWTYDDDGRLTSLFHSDGVNTIYGAAYEYEDAGNIATIDENRYGIVSTTNYAYDSRDELTQASGSGWARTYAYDSAGNRTATSGVGHYLTYSSNAASQYTSIGLDDGGTTIPGYDSNGNLTSLEDKTYTFDSDNKLVVAESPTSRIEIIYDGQRRPLARREYTRSTKTLVISQLYLAGGNAGATYTNDFVELHNRSDSTVSLTGHSLQYASATGSSWTKANLSGSIPAGGYFLIQLQGGANGVALPTPDATGGMNLSVTAGKVALSSSQTTLTGGCPTANIVDLVGYGASANCFEGDAPAPTAATVSSAIQRKLAGCSDTISNSTSFESTAVTPRTSNSAVQLCNMWNLARSAVVTYDAWTTILERGDGKSLQQFAGSAPEELIVTASDAGSSYHYQNIIRSVVAVKNSSEVTAINYNEFGFPQTPYNNEGSQARFAGRERLSGFALIDFRNRRYSEQLGQFISPEPMLRSQRFMQELSGERLASAYAYSDNNPASKIDPTGLWTIGIGIQFSAQFIWGVELDATIVFDDDYDVGFQLTPAGRLGPDIAIGANPALSWNWDADTINDLGGLGVFAAADVGPASGAATWAVNTQTSRQCQAGASDDITLMGLQASGLGWGAGLGVTFGLGYTFTPVQFTASPR